MSISAAQLLHQLQVHSLRVFTTADLLTLTRMNPPAATHALRRLASQDLVTRIKRGVWVNRFAADLHPYEAVAYLVAPWPAYLSLYSVLADHGIVDEIPQVIYGVSSSRPRRFRTPIGDFHIHHLPERLIWGYEIRRVGRASYPVAEPEKAFLDLIYLALIPRSPLRFPYRRGRRWKLDKRKLKGYATRFRFPSLADYLKQEGLW